jgi:hypothetical protein
MTLEQYAYASQIVGVIVVVGTLLYLSVQVKQGAKALNAASRQATMTAEVEFLMKSIDYPENTVGFGNDSLTAEQVRFTAWLVSYLRIREFAWFQYQHGILDATTWNSYMAPTGAVFASNWAKSVWRSGAIKMDAAFMAYVDKLIGDQEKSS